jgi:hypothetical protein
MLGTEIEECYRVERNAPEFHADRLQEKRREFNGE